MSRINGGNLLKAKNNNLVGMKNSLLEYIILYLLVACAALAIATLARISAVSLGVDSFTAFMVFIVVLAVQAVVYLSIHVVLQNTMLPWIGECLSKVPYFREKIENHQVLIIAEKELLNAPKQTSLEDIRNEQRQNRTKEQEDKLNAALNYTRKSFALYLSDEHLDVLCQNLRVYINELEVKELKPVKVKELTAIDLRHFGWNIWNYSKPRNQMDMALFLKVVFPDIFRETEVDSIKRHLKDDELKGTIKVNENIV
jgi:hypothetical protein